MTLKLKPSALIISAVLLTACGSVNPMPNVTVATNLPAATNIGPTIPHPTPSFTVTSTAVHKIRLYHNQTATRTTGDQYSFSVVTNKDADFIPKSIQITEEGTGLVIGMYELFDQTEMEALCANLMQNPNLKFYETTVINHMDLPQAFISRAYEGKFIFQITIEYSSGALEIIERVTPDDGCEMHVS